MRINLPARGNRILREVVARANADVSLRAWWHVANVNAVRRMRINDHSWVHIQVVANIAPEAAPRPRPQGRQAGHGRRLRRCATRTPRWSSCSARCATASGMAVHRRGHEDWSLFMAADRLPGMLEGLYEEPSGRS